MREIKYKVWNEELEEMYTISKEKYLGSAGIVDPYVGHETAVWLQFTGLTDKNGVEIYEGDIVNFKKTFISPMDRKTVLHLDKNFVVGEDKGTYYLKNLGEPKEKHPHPLYFDVDNCEVIGNIYQHKHLLKEKD